MDLRQQFIGCKTIIKKDFRRSLRIWDQTLLPPAITSALYFLIFGHILGHKLDLGHHFSYTEFIAPGLIMMLLITNAYSNSCFFVFSGKFQRNIEEILISPLSPFFMLIGFTATGVVRGIVVGIIVLIIASIFAGLSIYSILVILIVPLLAASLFSLAGVINGIYAKNFDDVNIVPVFILTPLTYLGGVFYSLKLLPAFWQKLSLLNPIFYLVNLFRYGFLGVSDSPLMIGLLILVSMNLICFGVAYFLIKKGVGLRQ